MADQWFILRDGKRHGPYSGADLKKYAASGHLLPIDLVVKDGMAKPVPAAKVKGLFPTAESSRQSAPDDFAGVTEQVRPASHGATRRHPRTKLYLVLAGCGLLAVVVIALVVLTSGRKPTTAKGPDVAKSGGETAGPGRVGGGGKAKSSSVEKHIEKPDFIRERYIERIFYKPAKLRYHLIHCNLVDIDDPSRNFTTRKYSSEINGITLYNDDDLWSNHYLQRSIQYQNNLLESELAARKKIFV